MTKRSAPLQRRLTPFLATLVLACGGSGESDLAVESMEADVGAVSKPGTPEGGEDASAARVKAFLAPAVQTTDFSGVVMVRRGGRDLVRQAFGRADFQWDVPMETGMTFPVASVTKTFTAAAILLLRDEGRLRLDDRLSDYLPSLRHARRATLLDLVLHRSGMPAAGEGPASETFARDFQSREQLIALLNARELEFEPGSDEVYSNSAYNLLAYVVEVVSGHAYDEFLRERFFNPLDMEHTGVARSELLQENMVSSYTPGPPPGHLLRAEQGDISHSWGSGSLYSNGDDLLRWAAAVQNRELFDVFPLIEEHGSWAWSYSGEHDRLRLNGTTPGGYASVQIFPAEDLQIVLLGNVFSYGVMQQIIAHLPDVIRGESAPSLTVRPTTRVGTSRLEDAIGSWTDSPLGDFDIVQRRGELYFDWKAQGMALYLAPVSDDVLHLPAMGSSLTLSRGPGGVVDELIFSLGRQEIPVPRVR